MTEKTERVMYSENHPIWFQAKQYDWVSPSSTRTPEDYPYSHSEYYLWREFEKGDGTAEAYYTDRMQSWDDEKYRAATKDRMTNWGSVPKSRSAAQEVVREYFGKEFECVGIAQSMNVSNGYPLGVFYIRKMGETK
jgi:hypothetical protein